MSAEQPLPCRCLVLQQRWLRSSQQPHFVLPEHLNPNPPPHAPCVMHSDGSALRVRATSKASAPLVPPPLLPGCEVYVRLSFLLMLTPTG